MFKLEKNKAIELDALFEELLIIQPDRIGHYDPFKAAKNTPLLKDMDEEYIKSLLYLARLEQRNIPTMFSGSSFIRIEEPAIRDFLKQGGFVEIFNIRQGVVRRENRRYYITNGLVVITIIIALIALFL